MREKLSSLKKRIKNQKGFTLIELMATLVILALIIAIAVPAVGNIVEKAGTKAEIANVELIENAAEIAYIADEATPKKASYTATELQTAGFLKADLDATEGAIKVDLDATKGNIFVVDKSSLPEGHALK